MAFTCALVPWALLQEILQFFYQHSEDSMWRIAKCKSLVVAGTGYKREGKSEK
jgi:hypothetical protein